MIVDLLANVAGCHQAVDDPETDMETLHVGDAMGVAIKRADREVTPEERRELLRVAPEWIDDDVMGIPPGYEEVSN